MKGQSFNSELTAFLKHFEPYFQKYFEARIKQSKQTSPLISRFYSDLGDFSSGGKRMRAFLVYLGWQVGRGPSASLRIKKILPVSLAIEIIHSFLLIHDDVIDKSETRHGDLTIHKRYEKLVDSHYGLSQAIMLGDIACFEALGLINSSSFNNGLKVACQRQLIKILLDTGYGEALDVETTYKGATLAQIRQVMDLKTARYSFVGPLAIGAILGEAKKQQIDGLTEFGLSCGIAFQLRDDFLGVFGDEEIVGKPMDLHEGKNTLLVYKTFELAKAQDKAYLKRVWGNKSASFRDLKKVRQIIENSGALVWSQKEQSKLVTAAKKVVSKITKSQILANIFLEMADFVVSRGK